MENNKCSILIIGDIQSIEGADKIVSAGLLYQGTKIATVVVGKDDFVDGDMVAYIDSNMAIEQAFIDYIDAQNPDHDKPDFQTMGRYLARGNRVRCIKLRGSYSDGLIIKLNLLFKLFDNEKTAIKTLVEGYSFTEIGDMKVCHKYVAPVKIQSQSAGKGKKKHLISRVIPELFNFHTDTQQALHNINAFTPESVLSLSRKLHGTSSICAYTKVNRNLKWFEKLLLKLGTKIDVTENDYLYASRTVVKNGYANSGYYDIDIWSIAGEKYFENKLHLGETVYYEIYGYLPSGAFIQKPFDYGCNENEYKIAVYRITLTSDDGTVAEYDWQAMKERCLELNVPMVEEFFYGKAKYLYPQIIQDKDWSNNFIKQLEIDYLERSCPYCKTKCPDEGIVLKLSGLYIRAFKLKSKAFILKESTLKDSEEFSDIEDGI